MLSDSRQLIRRGLLALRLSLGASVLFWGIVALEGPARGRILFAVLPGVQFDPQITLLVAVGEIALGVFIAMGLLRGLSYGLGFFLQALAVFASHSALLAPLDSGNAIFSAAAVVLVAHGVLFVLRGEDRLLAVDSMLSAGKRPEMLKLEPPRPHLPESSPEIQHVSD